MKKPEADISSSHSRCPEFYLWLKITLISFATLKRGWGHRDLAEEWLFDPDNDFFVAVCDLLGIDDDIMRQRIRKALREHNTSPVREEKASLNSSS